jgi:hypothetical protein
VAVSAARAGVWSVDAALDGVAGCFLDQQVGVRVEDARGLSVVWQWWLGWGVH